MTVDEPNPLGRSVWIEMDVDFSVRRFKPRRAVIVHVFDRPVQKEAIAAELIPKTILYLPYPHSVTNVVLQYSVRGDQSISKTFQKGLSYADVWELKNKKALSSGILTRKDIRRIGSADVFDWPKPSEEELAQRREAQKTPERRNAKT